MLIQICVLLQIENLLYLRKKDPVNWLVDKTKFFKQKNNIGTECCEVSTELNGCKRERPKDQRNLKTT